MNSLQRVLATVAGEPVDRPAYALLLSLYGARLTGAGLADHYSEPQVYVEGQCAVYEAFGPDLLFSPFGLPLLAQAFGGTLKHHATQAPTLATPPYPSVTQALAHWRGEPEAHPGLAYFSETIRLLARRYAGEVPVVGVMLSPADLPIMLLGVEGWLETLLCDEGSARALLARAGAFCRSWAGQLLDSGAAILAFTANFCNRELLPERIIEAITLPEVAAWRAGLASPAVLHHGGCRGAGALGRRLQVTGCVLDGRDALGEGRSSLGPDAVLLGGLDGPSLDTWQPEALEAHCRAILDERGQDPRFILASGSADVPLGTPPEVILAVGRALQGRGAR